MKDIADIIRSMTYGALTELAAQLSEAGMDSAIGSLEIAGVLWTWAGSAPTATPATPKQNQSKGAKK